VFNFFRKSCRLWDYVEKYCRARLAIDENMVHAIACWITKSTHTHTLRVCNTLCFSTANTVARERFNTRLNDSLFLICAYFDFCYKYQYYTYFRCLNVSGVFFRLFQISALQLLWECYSIFWILSASVGFLMKPTVQAAAVCMDARARQWSE
jgi:hypothetical protein